MAIKFKGKPWKAGNSTVVTIPSDFIEQGLIPTDTDTEFSFEATE